MRTQEQYLEKLKSMRHNIYLDGECIGRDDPRIVKASSAIRMTFSLVDNPEMHDLMTATSHITGKTINRFTHIHQCPEDLLKKQEMTRKICGMCGGCVQRCMGIDMMNALSSVVKDVDTKYGTPYYERFLSSWSTSRRMTLSAPVPRPTRRATVWPAPPSSGIPTSTCTLSSAARTA